MRSTLQGNNHSLIPFFFSLCSLFDSVKALIVAFVFHNEKFYVALVAYMFTVIQKNIYAKFKTLISMVS